MKFKICMILILTIVNATTYNLSQYLNIFGNYVRVCQKSYSQIYCLRQMQSYIMIQVIVGVAKPRN